MRFPIVFAHRGANSFAPENSLPAFQHAIDMGCEGIEMDVRLSGSDDIVVFHDRHTFRMTGVRGNVQKIPLSQLRKLRLEPLGFSPEKIPTLQDVLDLAGKKVLINIDVKKESLGRNGFEEKIVDILKDQGLEDNILISSFNPFVLKKISALNSQLHVGFIFRNRSSMMMLNGHPVQSLHARYAILSKRYVENLRERDSKIYAWTVDDKKNMLDLITKKVDGIITNRPELFLDLKNRLSGQNVKRKPEILYQSE